MTHNKCHVQSNNATITVNDHKFTTTSEHLRNPIEKLGVMHHTGVLQTQNIKITK